MSRLQKAELAGNSYQGSAQSVGFNPQQAASEAADTQQLKQAIAADGATISREIQRVQTAENTLMSAQQAVARSGQQKDQASEAALFRANQQIDQANLRDNQLFDKSILEQQQTYEKGKMALICLRCRLVIRHQTLNYRSQDRPSRGCSASQVVLLSSASRCRPSRSRRP